MKLRTIFFVLVAGLAAHAQTTPNLHFNVPAFNSPNWNVPMNANFNALDCLLSGNCQIPSLNVGGPLNVGVSGSGCASAFTLTNTDNAPTNPVKTIRVNTATGALEFMNNACTTVIFSIADAGGIAGNTSVGGNLGVGGNLNVVGSASFNNVFATYNNRALMGTGIPAIYCATSQKVEAAADTNVLTCTPIPIGGRYRLTFTMDVSAQNTATLGWTATWTDSNSHAQTPANLSLFVGGTAAPALTFTAATNGHYYGSADIDIDNTATNIVIKLTFSGTSFTAKVSATVEELI